MLMKELCSFAWVNETYRGVLPDLPWARSRLATSVASTSAVNA